jgi:imidazolonepropionase-like amidohydrolase
MVAGPASAFINGQWFNGSSFELRAMYVVNGIFVEDRPARIDRIVDLAGDFVIPPFGDAHTHNLDGSFGLAQTVEAYVREGTFYVQVLTNRRTGAEQVRTQFTRPCSIDVAYAHGGLSSTLSHPFLAYEPRVLGVFDNEQARARLDEISQSRTLHGNAYWFIDNEQDLATEWPAIVGGYPDLLKIFLLDASEDAPVPERIAQTPTGLDTGHGLKPSLVAPIVERAHARGLRVAAHVQTAGDAAIAIDAGVDILAHLPGYDATDDQSDEALLLTGAVARRAGNRRVVVIPTASRVTTFVGAADSVRVVARRRTLLRQNVQLLVEHGAQVVVGSDYYGDTALREYAALGDLEIWDPAELLRIWAEHTPRSIFPARRIGRLTPGYEASFLVLDSNPLEGINGLTNIRLRVKQGCLLEA